MSDMLLPIIDTQLMASSALSGLALESTNANS